MPWRRKKAVVKAFDPSTTAAFARGPKHLRPARSKASTTPATSGASGPTMVSPTWARRAKATSPGMSSAAIATFETLGSRAVPALPGAQYTRFTRGDCAHFHASACSRPPPPMTRTFTSVPEVAHAGEHHRHAVLVGSRDHFRVADRSARLDDG